MLEEIVKHLINKTIKVIVVYLNESRLRQGFSLFLYNNIVTSS